MKRKKTEVEERLENFARWIISEYLNNNSFIFYQTPKMLVKKFKKFMTGGK